MLDTKNPEVFVKRFKNGRIKSIFEIWTRHDFIKTAMEMLENKKISRMMDVDEIDMAMQETVASYDGNHSIINFDAIENGIYGVFE